MNNRKKERKDPRIMPHPITEPLVKPIIGEEDILSDVQGSYTGVPIDGQRPIQDADDL